MTDWATYKRAERGHNSGNHSVCHPGRCDYASRLWFANDEHLMSVALLAEIAAQGLDARGLLGDEHAATVASARAEFPGFFYLEPDPDFVHELRARVRVKDLCLTK